MTHWIHSVTLKALDDLFLLKPLIFQFGQCNFGPGGIAEGSRGRTSDPHGMDLAIFFAIFYRISGKRPNPMSFLHRKKFPGSIEKVTFFLRKSQKKKKNAQRPRGPRGF